MDNRSIFSKTGKGSLEITKKTIKLSSEERQALILVDGKSNYDELQEKLARVPPVKLRAVFEKLISLELIREFVAKAAPAAALAATSAGSLPDADGDDELDFTALAPAGAPASSSAPKIDLTVPPSKRVDAPPSSAATPSIDAAEEARKFQEMMFGASPADQEAEAARKAAAEAQLKAAEAEALRKADVARKVAEDQARRKVQAERISSEEAARKTAEQEAQRTAIEEEARRSAEAERAARDAAARQVAEDEARRKAEAERLVREEAARKAETEQIEREAREREEAARRAAEEEARRKAEAERLAREEAARQAAEEEARRQAEAERLAREEAARKAETEQIEREAREREEAARRAAEEEARRKAEAERLAREEAARQAAEEEARRQAEAERLAREEAARKAEAERIEREAREREEAARRAAEEEAHRRAEAERAAREEAARKAAQEETRRQAEAERIAKEEAARKAEAERIEREAREREEAARRQAEAERAARDERERQEREQFAREQAARRAAEEAAQYVAALTPQIEAVAPAAAPAPAAPAAPAEPASLDFNAEAKAAFDADLNFAPQTEEGQRKAEVDRLMMGAFADNSLGGATPLSGSGPDTFADTGSPSLDPATDSSARHKELESASRKEIEREAKERAKDDAKTQKAAEKEAKLAAKEGKITLRRSGPSVMTMIFGVIAVALIGAVAYLFMMPIDKAAIERALTDRLGETVTVGTAKFSPFPPQLELANVSVGAIKLATVTANPDPATLITDRKIWKSVDASGVTMSADHAGKLIALALRPVPASAAAKVEIQRIKLSGVDITGMAVAMPKFDFVGLLNPAGALKQITLSLPDDKAQARLAPDANGWGVDVESRGVAWPVGPKIAWESIRARGSATANGIKFDEYTITQFGGSGRGAGELSWKDGWKFNGNIDISGVDIEALGTAFYGTSPATGALDGKFNVVLSASSAARLFDAPQIDGAFIANKAAVKNIDLARTAQSGAVAAGTTRFSDFSATLAVAGGKLQVKELKGVSGLLTVSGTAEVPADKSLGGGLTVELGVGGSRAKAIVKLSGTLAEPKLTK